MTRGFNSFTLFYPQNQAFICSESHLPERLMIVDGTYRAFQIPHSWLVSIILIPFILAWVLMQLAKLMSIWNLPEFARLTQFMGYAIGGLGTLNLLSVFFKPLLFQWLESLWTKRRATYILQNGGKVIDGWVINVSQDSDKDWCIEFKISQDSDAKLYMLTRPFLPDHLYDLENGSILKLLRYKGCLYML